ncbi:MAG: D-glycero-beta-D-manno-heptose 1-phosphate adenylyltransferase [Alphaproteobacteria bacterium]|nr:D-glycero-beta-D-manno-heptose 1-phosphate adenylyltransferase [Alphaproteobacteria bacterium]
MKHPLSFRHYLAQPWAPGDASILVVGDAMLDIYVSGTVERISPEAPVPVVKFAETGESAGGAANVAANIASLGGTCHLVACCGQDVEATRLAALLVGAALTFDLVPVEGRPTTAKTRFAAGQHQLLRLDKESLEPIPAISENAALAAIARQIGHCGLVVLSDYAKGMLTDRVIGETITLARAHGVPVVVDPKRKDFSVYRGAAALKPNRLELEGATGLPARSDAEVERAGARAVAGTGASVLVTRSEAGMSLIPATGGCVHMPTHARAVYDVTGAGDTVMAAFAVGLASGQAMEEAMAFANLAGGIAVSKPGTALVAATELEAERALIAEDHFPARGEIVRIDEAVRLREMWRRQGLVVGFTNGCFDLIHPGHISLLHQAAEACDRLIVGLNSDQSVKRLKGAERPVQTAAARAAVLAAIEHVNLVVVFHEDTPGSLIERLLPDVLVKGADYTIDKVVGADTVVAAGGRVVLADLVAGQSTTQLIGRSRATADSK